MVANPDHWISRKSGLLSSSRNGSSSGGISLVILAIRLSGTRAAACAPKRQEALRLRFFRLFLVQMLVRLRWRSRLGFDLGRLVPFLDRLHRFGDLVASLVHRFLQTHMRFSKLHQGFGHLGVDLLRGSRNG